MTGAALESRGAEASNSTRADIGGQCREVFEGRWEVNDLPVRGRVFLEAGSPMRRRITRCHVDGGQWDSEPSTHSLDGRFLPNPGSEEVPELIFGASIGDESGFRGREKPLGERQNIDARPHALDVHADDSLSTETKQGKGLRVRQVESQ